MAYNPGITNRSGEILAQGIASAAQTRMQGYQNATNTLLKSFTDLSKKQQEEEIKRNEALAKFKSDPDLLAKLGEKGNEDLKARYDRINAPVEGFWAKYAGRGDLEDSDLLYKYATGTQEATARATAKEVLGYERAKQKRLSDEDAGIDAFNRGLRAATGSLRDTSALTPISGQNAPYNPTNFTTPFNPPSNVPPTRVSSFLANQSNMMRDNPNPPPTVAGLINNNPFMQSPRETPMDISARNLAQTLPTFNRNDGSQEDSRVSRALGGSQVIAKNPAVNSIVQKLIDSNVRITPAMYAAALGDQAKIDLQEKGLAIEQQKADFQGESGTFDSYDENNELEVRTWFRRGNEIYDEATMLPIASPTTDVYGVRSLTRTVFPRKGGKGKPTPRPGLPAAADVGAGASNSRNLISPSGRPYILTTSGQIFTNTGAGSRR